ncbi:hypothetical protein [Clostridium transplantifaecale]|uniref:hypothetical protein n=1 Tax=Clostridium transplantifaecale TaxID=2479838 RepID=UPI000F62F47D|nr:hypothetical protein [Clostridium transplantifaecale]
MNDFFYCILMNGEEIDFDRKCNSYVHNDGFVRFDLVCPETDKGIILQEINGKEISRIMHCYDNRTIDELFRKEPEIVVPNKKIITS